MAVSISHRLSLKSQLAELPHAQSLLQEFDMCRVFSGDLDLQDAMNYAALEHAVRIGTKEEDIQRYYDLLPGDLAITVIGLVKRKEEVGQLVMQELEAAVTDENIHETPLLPVYLILYELTDDNKLTRTIQEPEEAGNWPIVCCLQTGSLLCLLYPPGVTFLDGFDAYTCELRDVIVPPSVLQSIRPSLTIDYMPISTSVQTQTKRAASPIKEAEAMGLGCLSNEKDLPPQPVSESYEEEVAEASVEFRPMPVMASSREFIPKPVKTPPIEIAPRPVQRVAEPPPPEPLKPLQPLQPPKPVPSTNTVVYEWKAPNSKPKPAFMGLQRLDHTHIHPSSTPLPMMVTKRITIHKGRVSRPSLSKDTPVSEDADTWKWSQVTPKPAARQQPTRELCGVSECCLS